MKIDFNVPSMPVNLSIPKPNKHTNKPATTPIINGLVTIFFNISLTSIFCPSSWS